MTDQDARLSLYRQWRPRTFSEIVGQEAIVQTLRNAVLSNEVAHAYLFSGERGIGKTSAARILARAVNCLNPSEGEPCNTCANCTAILANRSLDIVEIDGASNRGIDHIRQLREEVNFAPTDLKRKVYIIDEVHMLTNEAFNALLKTLEEPPPHVMFVFATTEPHKVPRTIISRCQAFEFRRISPEKIIGHLSTVAESMGVSISEEALSLIAHRANGGMRDALVMLEQGTSYGGDNIEAETVLDMLGLADRAVHEGFLAAIEGGDRPAVIETIDQLIDRGKDLEIFLADVLELLRERLRQPSSQAAFDIVVSQGLLELKGDLFRSLDRRIQFEIGALALMESLSPVAEQAAQPKQPAASTVRSVAPKAAPREQGGRSGSQASKGRVAEPTEKADHTPTSSGEEGQTDSSPGSSADAIPTAPSEGTSAREPHEAVGVDVPAEGPASPALPENCRAPWQAMLEEIQQDRIAIAAFLVEGSPALEDDHLVISFHPDHSFHKDSLEMRDNLTYLAGAVRRHFGNDIHVEIKTDESVSRKPLPHDLLMEKARMVCKAVDGKIVKEDW